MFATHMRIWARRRRAVGLAIFSGLLYALGFCGFDQDLLAWFCLAPAIAALDDIKLGQRGAWSIGWLTGWTAHLGVYTWLIGMLVNFGGLSWPFAFLGYLAICLIQSILFALWGLGTWVLVHRYRVSIYWAAPTMMVVAEWVIPALFPSYLANSQYLRPLIIQSCSIWGVLGLTFVLTFSATVAYGTVAAILGYRSDGLPWRALGAWTVLFCALLGYGAWSVHHLEHIMQHTRRHLKVGLVQTNMGIFEKTENPIEGVRRHQQQSLELEKAGAELIIWSESGYYLPIDAHTQNVKRQVLGHLSTPLLFGGLRTHKTPRDTELFNSAFLTDHHGNILGSYDKVHLLAFGEYLPLGEYFPRLYDLSPQTSRFWRGQRINTLEFEGIRIGMLICYEDVLPAFVRQVMELSPDLLVNLTNDAWFGQSSEPRIHMALAIFRAVEHKRYLVRSTNTGISAIIDPAGRVLTHTPTFTRANLLGDVQPMSGTTVYQILGDWPGVLSLLAIAFWIRQTIAQRFKNGFKKRFVQKTRPAHIICIDY